MKRFFRLCLTIIVSGILFSSCSKSNDEGKMIPKNAMFVALLNTKSLSEKVTWDDVKQTSWYKQMYADTATKDWMKKLLDNPENSGIDSKASIIFFVKKGGGDDYDIVFEGQLKNEKDFEQFNKNLDPASTAKKDGDINMLTMKENSVVGWNDKHFAYVTNSNSIKSKYAADWDTMNNQSNMSHAVDNNTLLSALCKSLFSLKSDSSLAKNEKFSKLLSEKGDIHAWVNTEEMIKNNSAMGMLGMLKLDIFFKDNISTYTVDFDNGKIKVNQRAYAGKEFTDFLKKYKGGNINTNMIGNIPSQNVIGVFAMNYKPEGLKELIKLTGMDGFINMYAGQMGFNLDDFVKATNGDLMVAFSDLKMKSDSLNYKDGSGNTSNSNVYSKPDVSYLFSVGIGDKQSFQKLIDAGKKIGNAMGGKDDLASFNMNDKTFAIGNTQPTVTQYLAGSKNKFAFTDKLSGHTIGLFIDVQKILSVLNNESLIKDADAKTIMAASMKTWNNVYFTGGEMDNDAMTGNTEINFVDQSTNSLKQLNHYFDEIAKVMLAKKEREKSQWNVPDSLMIPPPIDTVGH
ncbi:MAG: DUF4836 family protein [Ginsengibacter sp.]